MKKSFISDKRGFSLIELIVAVLIVGVLAVGAAMSISVIYNADTERAAKNLSMMLTKARTEAVASNEESTTQKVEIVAVIEQKSDGDYYASVQEKKTPKTYDDEGNPSYGTPTYELIEEKKITNYWVALYIKTKGSSVSDIADEGDPNELKYGTSFARKEYTFRRGTGGIVGNDCDIYLVGSDTYKIIISNASGKCFIENY